MFVARPPMPLLRPFVAQLWATDDAGAGTHTVTPVEHTLPTGLMHLVFRLDDAPLRLRESPQDAGVLLRGALVGGARSRYVIRERSAPACSVAAVLRPGAASLLFGGGAHELAGRHTPLDELWGREAALLRERLQQAPDAVSRMALLEAALAARLPRVRALHPGIAAVLARMDAAGSVAAAVAHSGVSHRHFVAQFRAATGLAPKTWLRVQRFQCALRQLRRGDALATVAADAGYSDQAHFGRDFVAFSGVTPTAYRSRLPPQANHVPVALPGQISSRLRGARRG
ncbi:MAG: helix-turn-helix transcriptional regulator [Pseudomonadota bacterium]|nr:helix-turn-helix transcriptional regulator [Pseudomonadota bacterium]